MLGMGDLMLGAAQSGLICTSDPSRANMTHMFRGLGTSGSKPTSADVGPATWVYRNSSIGSIVTTQSKWTTQYGSSLSLPGNGLLIDPDAGGNNTPFQIIGSNTSQWSMMMRVKVPNTYDESNVILREVGYNSSDWGQGSIILRLRAENWGGTSDFKPVLQFPDTGNAGGVVTMSSETQCNGGQWHEILVTRNGSNTYLFVNGALTITSTTTSSNAFSPSTLRVGTNSTSDSGSNSFSGKTMFLNDDIMWNTCITTTSYTPKTNPFC